MPESRDPWGGADAPPHVVSTLSLRWPGRASTPAALRYFCDRGADLGAAEALRQARASGRKVIGLFCTFIPEEIILAANAVPVRLCSGLPPTGSQALPRDVCPVVRSALDLVESGPLNGLLDAAVVPTTCDWKVQAASRLTDVPVLRVQLPRSPDPRALADELRRTVGALAEITDFSLTAASLRRAVETVARGQAAHRRIEALRRRPQPPLSGCEAMLIADTYGYGDLAGWTQACEGLAVSLEETESSVPGSPRARIVLFGSPTIWPNYKVPHLVESSGAVVVGDDFCSRRSRLFAPEVPTGKLGDMLLALAQRAIEPCTCGVAAKASTRREALMALVAELDADGVICHYLRGCAPVAAGQTAIVSALRDAGVPALTIETDASQEDIEGLRTRIEAFVELLNH